MGSLMEQNTKILLISLRARRDRASAFMTASMACEVKLLDAQIKALEISIDPAREGE